MKTPHFLGLLLLSLLALSWSQAFGQAELINANLVVAGHANSCADSGTVNAYACILDRTITAYTTRACYSFLANSSNTAAATVNYSGLGAKTIKKVQGSITTDLVANDIRTGQIVVTCYDGTNMQMVSQLGNAAGGAPGGSATQVQYNNAGAFGGSTGVTLDAGTIIGWEQRATTMTGDLTLGSADGPVIACTSGATNKTATLPAAATATQGHWRLVKVDSGAGACVLAPSGSDTLNGVNGTRSATTQWSYVEVDLTSTTNWSATAGQTAVNLATDVTGDLLYANLTPATGASLLLGRGAAAGGGDWQEVTLGTGLSMSGTTLSAPGGSTGISGATNQGAMYATAATTGTSTAAMTNGQVLMGTTGSAPSNKTLTLTSAKTTTYTITTADFYAYTTFTVASGTFTMTLPINTGQPSAGTYIRVINYGSGVVTIARNGQNLNGGTASLVLPASTATDPSAAMIVSDGTNYVGAVEDGTVAIAKVTGGTQLVASGTLALATSAIASGACSAAQTATATGTLTTDVVLASFGGDPTAVTGYAPTVNGMLTILPYPTANTFNAKVCNNTTASITPGAITLNWKVVR